MAIKLDTEAAAKLLLERFAAEKKAKEEAEEAEPIVIRNAPFLAQVKEPHEDKARVVNPNSGPDIFGLQLPEDKSLDAAGFMLAMRNAGKRPFKATNMNGEEIYVVRVDQSKIRDDQIIAISKYCGYEPRDNFGAQEAAARMRAMRELKIAKQPWRKPDGTIPTIAEDHKKIAEGNAFVAGVADHHQKRMLDLRARETDFVSELIPLEKMVENALNLSTNPRVPPEMQEEADQIYRERLAELTVLKARLNAIQHDIEFEVETEPTFDK
jgi:hypothetical protein